MTRGYNKKEFQVMMNSCINADRLNKRKHMGRVKRLIQKELCLTRSQTNVSKEKEDFYLESKK